MAVTDLVEQLAAHKTLGSAPRAELEWIAAHGIMRHLEKNEVLTRADKNISVEGLFVVLSGRIAIYVDRGSGTNKVMEWKAGDVTGFLPYSRMGNPPGDTVAQEPSTALLVKKEHFPELIRECQEVTAILVHKMLDRAREFKSKDLLDERLMSLGRISAGTRPRVEQPGVGHRAQRGVARQAARGNRACGPCARGGETHRRATRGGRRAPVLLYDRDSPRRALADPAGRARRCNQRLARCASFACRHRDGARRERGHDRGARPVRESRRWSGARSGAPLGGGRVPPFTRSPPKFRKRRCASQASSCSIKGFSHMDQATVAEPVDLPVGLSNTIDVLKSKARSKSVSIAVTVEPNLPKVLGFIGELNQVWANLIDNALDAVAQGGHIDITASRESRGVVVHIIDNGTGIAPENSGSTCSSRSVTTKPVGARHRPRSGHRAQSGDPQRRRHQRGLPPRAHRFQRVAAARGSRRRRSEGMNKPVILVADDDAQVLAAVRRDLAFTVPGELHHRQRLVGRGGARRR